MQDGRKLPEGPTLNLEYNGCWHNWQKTHPSDPECECCGRDMTGGDVEEGFYGWYCSEECLNEAERLDFGPYCSESREDFHADG